MQEVHGKTIRYIKSGSGGAGPARRRRGRLRQKLPPQAGVAPAQPGKLDCPGMNPADAFPVARYRLRYRTFDPGLPCGQGCAYSCCDPVITCFHIEEDHLAERLAGALGERCRQVLRLAPFLEFQALSLPELPPVAAIDTAPPPPGFVRVNLLWRCPHLSGGLCSVHDQPKPSICTRYVHCPEHSIASLDEERFLELARLYWGLRRRVMEWAAGDVFAALSRREEARNFFLK